MGNPHYSDTETRLKRAKSLPDTKELSKLSHSDILRMKLDAPKDDIKRPGELAQSSNDVIRDSLGTTADLPTSRERKASQPPRLMPVPGMYGYAHGEFPNLGEVGSSYVPKDVSRPQRSRTTSTINGDSSSGSSPSESPKKSPEASNGKQKEASSSNISAEQPDNLKESSKISHERTSSEVSSVRHEVPLLTNAAREEAHKTQMEHEKALILKMKERRYKDLIKGGINGQKKVLEGYIAEHTSEGEFKNQKIKQPKAEIHELMNASERTKKRFEDIEVKRVSVAKDLYENPDIPQQLLGDGLIKKRSFLNELEDLKEQHAKYGITTGETNRGDSVLLSNLVHLSDHVEKCVKAGEENFSDLIHMKTQILNNAESLYHYFDKYEKASIVINYHNKKIRHMRDIFTSSDTTINGMITNLGWSEIGTQNRFQPIQSELFHLAQHIPVVTEFYASAQKELPQLQFTPLQQTHMEKMTSYLTGSSEIVRQNQKSVSNVTRRLGECLTNRRAADFPEKEALEKIRASIELYASSMLEKQVQKVVKGVYGHGAFMRRYNDAYKTLQADVKEIERYAASVKDGTYKNQDKPLAPIDDAQMHRYELHLNRFIANSKELRLNVAREIQNAQKDCENYLTGSHQNILFRNMEEYSRALRSLGNVVQKISTSMITGAIGHAVGGFPNT